MENKAKHTGADEATSSGTPVTEASQSKAAGTKAADATPAIKSATETHAPDAPAPEADAGRFAALLFYGLFVSYMVWLITGLSLEDVLTCETRQAYLAWKRALFAGVRADNVVIVNLMLAWIPALLIMVLCVVFRPARPQRIYDTHFDWMIRITLRGVMHTVLSVLIPMALFFKLPGLGTTQSSSLNSLEWVYIGFMLMYGLLIATLIVYVGRMLYGLTRCLARKPAPESKPPAEAREAKVQGEDS